MSDRSTTSSLQPGVHLRSGTVAYNPGQAPGTAAFGTDQSGATVQTTMENYRSPSAPPTAPRPADSPAQPSVPSFNRDLPAKDRLGVLLAVNDTLQAKMGAKIEEAMHELEAESASPPRSKRPKPEAADGPPTPLEKGDPDDPVVLSPPGKTQRLLDAAKE